MWPSVIQNDVGRIAQHGDGRWTVIFLFLNVLRRTLLPFSHAENQKNIRIELGTVEEWYKRARRRTQDKSRFTFPSQTPILSPLLFAFRELPISSHCFTTTPAGSGVFTAHPGDFFFHSLDQGFRKLVTTLDQVLGELKVRLTSLPRCLKIPESLGQSDYRLTGSRK